MKTTASILSFIVTAGLVPSVAADMHSPPRHHFSPIGIERTVYVAETGPTSPAVQKRAQETAACLFGRIGVRLRFTTVPPAQADRDVIRLHIWNHAPKNLPPSVVGAANIKPNDVLRAFVFYNRILAFYPSDRPSDIGVLLGYAIAHEVGHILRAEPGHSEDGVMRACWMQRDIVPMLQETVRFSKTDAERIRAAHVTRRAAGLVAMETN